jgi:hypothetical protein
VQKQVRKYASGYLIANLANESPPPPAEAPCPRLKPKRLA